VARAGWHEAPHEPERCSVTVVVAVMTTSSKELLHKLNNQLGVILAHAELLETKAQDASQKARASQVVNAALQAMAVSRELRETVGEK
jgi:putative Ca2+/H+ antiporter (TMEM165/GDT1 family)